MTSNETSPSRRRTRRRIIPITVRRQFDPVIPALAADATGPTARARALPAEGHPSAHTLGVSDGALDPPSAGLHEPRSSERRFAGGTGDLSSHPEGAVS
jgi:hypothetical protein